MLYGRVKSPSSGKANNELDGERERDTDDVIYDEDDSETGD